MRRTKANRALTFVMAAALLIGSIHGVGAKEQSKAYEAPELTLVQGASDYDLTEGITYDSEKYTLSVTDTGNFDINVAGDYEISYALTEKESSVSETESVENTESADIIESTETVSGTETVDTTETIENTDQTPEGDDQTSGTDTADQDKPDQPADKDEADSAKDPTDSGNAGQLQGTSTGVGEAQESENQDDGNTDTVKEESADTDTVNITEEQTPKAANATQEVINFSRTVKVVAAEEPVETYAANYRVASYANVQGNYTVNLGTPVWTDDTHKKFQYTNAKIDTGSDDISLMTITLSNGKLPADILNDATVRDDYGRSATWIFMDKKSSQEIEKKIQNMTFDYTNDMNVYVSVNANENEGFDSNLDNLKLTQWSKNGHFYLHVKEKVSWAVAYDRAKEYKLGGERGYLTTITTNDELSYILTLQTGQTWTAGTRLIMKDGSSINDTPFGRITNGIVKYGQDYYWAAGPETGEKIVSLWGSGEPNRASIGYGALNGTISDVQGQESCVMVRNSDLKTLNDIIEGNVPGDTNLTASGFFVEFGGYADGADPGQPDNTKTGETNVLVAPMDAEAVINGVKYAPLADALDTAQTGDTVEIVKDTVTAVTGGTLKKGVKLKSKNGTWFSAPNDAVDVTLDVAADGTITLKDGTLNVSDNGTLNVYSPVDHNTYKVTTPAGASSVVVPNGTGDDTPYLKNHNTTGELTLKIGDVTYTYTNQSFNAITLVYIPDAMYRNELVTKAEVPADKTAEIRLDDTDSVKTKGTGNASDKVTVERRSTDKKADVKIPSGASADVFGHEVGSAPANGVTVSQGSTINSGYPSRDYVTIPVGESIVTDGVTYNATDSVQRYYLGTFNVAVTTGNNAEISGGAKPADPGYLQQYKVKISPKTHFDLDKDNFTVTMKKSDTGAAETLSFAQVCTEETDGSITVTIPQVTGDITINAAAKRQLTTLNVEGLTAGGAKGIFKAVDASGNTYELADDGSIQINRNEELTLTFTPDDFDDRYYSDLTGEKGESFSILTALTDTTDGNKDLFATATFNWTEKSYEITYTPTKADVTLKAVFTPSHIVHLHVTGGTAEVTDNTLVTKETGASQFQHVIVADDKTVEVKLKDTTANGLAPTAYWSDVSESPEHAGMDVSAAIQTTGAKTYTYTTQKVKQPQALNVTFEQGQTVEVTVNNGKLLNDDGAWNENSGTYTRIVKNNAPLVLKIKPDDGYGLKGITVNGYPIDIEKALEDRALEYDSVAGVYTHTTHGIYQAWKVTVDLEKQHQFIFEDQNGAQIPDTWGDIRIDLGGHTITGDKADDDNAAKPGLEFVKDANSNEHPGTNLEIVNGTIKGGDGSAKHPDGAAGIGASGDTADAGIIIGNNANVTGGNGANGTEGKDGGNGGAGIDGNGKITPTVSGTVTGGNGGKGGNSATDIPGNGGNGGSGISAGDKTITINPGGTVKGGDAGNGGNATGDNTNPGGNGGNGGTGTETTQPGKTDNNGGTTSGGNGGDGGKSDNGNGGNGGNGGSGSTGENNNNGGTSSGGSGGNGGDSDKGNGGSGGNGGSSGETGGTGGDNTGGNGGNGGGSNNGNGGTGGNGGDSNNGTGGNGGNGGDSNNGTGGSGGNGGDSNSGTGGNGGNGGGSDSGNGKDPGNGGNGGGSNSGNNGSSGSDGSKPDNNGGNGGSNGGDNGNNNGGSGSGGNSNGDTNGTNTGVTDGKTNATDIAAADGNNASGGNKNNKHNRNNRNNKSDQADGEDVTEGTETGADTGSDYTTDVADSTETGADADGSGNADDSIPADSSDADGHISFADCGSHWYPVILILVIAGYTVLRIRKIREELDGE